MQELSIKLIFLLLNMVVINVYSCIIQNPSYWFRGTDLMIRLTRSGKGFQKYSIVRGGIVLQTVTLDNAFAESTMKITPKFLTLIGKDQTTQFEILDQKDGVTVIQVKRNLIKDQSSQDCFDLNIGDVNWYGGPENRYQYWPVEKASFTNFSYIAKEEDNTAITERYWLNSNGIFIYIEDDVPLFINQNINGLENKICFNSTKILPYDIEDNNFTLNYRIGVASDLRQAHLYVTNNIFKKPNKIPDERMIRYPIWSTWALYKTEIDENIVRDFANNITQYNFNNSHLEIDDNWEICYGSLTFDTNKFSDIKNLTDDLKQQGFRITLWIHPFINKNCTLWYNEAKNKKYLVEDQEGNTDTQWWNSDHQDAAYIDFTNEEAANWFMSRLIKLKEAGIDSFKFDAGETSWSPLNSKQNGTKNLYPHHITVDYVRKVSELGPMVEIRSGHGTQDLGVFLRMIDKDSEWNFNNGLPTLITTLFQLNFAGYNFILPDMIGGNGYNNNPPNKDLFIRWLQVNTFMPSLQFSYVPWLFDDETVEISQKFTNLHDNLTDYIIERFNLVTETGEPVNPPIWWINPNDIVARQIYDEFLLGDKYLSAPVIGPNLSERDIYLPEGIWRDGNNNKLYIGPIWLMRYPAPLDTLPYFIKEE